MTCFERNTSPSPGFLRPYTFFSLKQLRIHSRASSRDMARPLKSCSAKSGPSDHTPFRHTSHNNKPALSFRILQSSPLKNAYQSIFIFGLPFPLFSLNLSSIIPVPEKCQCFFPFALTDPPHKFPMRTGITHSPMHNLGIIHSQDGTIRTAH